MMMLRKGCLLLCASFMLTLTTFAHAGEWKTSWAASVHGPCPVGFPTTQPELNSDPIPQLLGDTSNSVGYSRFMSSRAEVEAIQRNVPDCRGASRFVMTKSGFAVAVLLGASLAQRATGKIAVSKGRL
ncbi:MAG: hypothetical protein LBI59_00075 [Candidatus Accumulibacter sp.]|jgi:hypothetical protein|nr:hypothetical protein [Accumulibacter sp.]